MTDSKLDYIGEAARDPDNVLRQAVGGYESCLVLGYSKAGDLDVRISTNMRPADALFAAQRFCHMLMDGALTATAWADEQEE